MKSGVSRPSRRKGSPLHYLLSRPLILWLAAAVVFAALVMGLNVYLVHSLRSKGLEDDSRERAVEMPQGRPTGEQKKSPVVWIYHDTESPLGHVKTVFHRLGYDFGGPLDDWDVMWSHGYPFKTFTPASLKGKKAHQKINHFPGSGCFTFKPQLATLSFPFVPKAFQLPSQAEALKTEAAAHPNTLWVQKNNKHRGIKVKDIKAIDLYSGGSFVQEFISNPILIDGRKFDIGVYTAITSVDPLRVYTYGEEILVRFCSEEYLPFNAADPKKYVVDDYYTTIWQVPSMTRLVSEQMFSTKQALNVILREKGYDSDQVWEQVQSIIQQVLLHCESMMVDYTSRYSEDSRHFFEMVRFDFVIDEELKVWLMEVNLSPNLSSSHTPGNRNMYEQVLFNLLNLVGLARATHDSFKYNGEFESVMLVNEHDIQIPLKECSNGLCKDCNSLLICKLCRPCRDGRLSFQLKTAFLEHVSRRNFRRVYPQPNPDPMNFDPAKYNHSLQSQVNFLMGAWFSGKCQQDSSWCV